MRFGLNFFPGVTPAERTGEEFYDDCLELCEVADELGYASVKIVEHYFFAYGGYSPDPVTFLASAAQRTRRMRLVTGAVVPAFTHPLKLAGKLAMLDNLSHGRLDVGFARAFLPDEFEAFQTSMDESRERFVEGIEAVRRLWTEEDVVWRGRFHQFGPVTMLPRPLQQPHPPIFVAATFTPESFEWAGREGHNLMMVPYASTHEKVAELLGRYRTARLDAGHPAEQERVQLTFHCVVAEDGDEARRLAKVHFDDFMAKLLIAVSAWSHTKTDAYRGYERLADLVRETDFDRSVGERKLLVGDPHEVAEQVAWLRDIYGDVEFSLQVNIANMARQASERSLRLFAEHVMPAFVSAPAGATP